MNYLLKAGHTSGDWKAICGNWNRGNVAFIDLMGNELKRIGGVNGRHIILKGQQIFFLLFIVILNKYEIIYFSYSGICGFGIFFKAKHINIIIKFMLV